MLVLIALPGITQSCHKVEVVVLKITQPVHILLEHSLTQLIFELIFNIIQIVFKCINDFRTAFTIIASWQKLPEFLLSTKYFQETKLFAETRIWHAKYCLVISDICFQSLHADRKFWSHRYFFLLLCTHISGNTGYLDGEIFLPYRKKKNLSKSWSQWKDQLNRCIEVCRRQFRKLLN